MGIYSLKIGTIDMNAKTKAKYVNRAVFLDCLSAEIPCSTIIAFNSSIVLLVLCTGFTEII